MTLKSTFAINGGANEFNPRTRALPCLASQHCRFRAEQLLGFQPSEGVLYLGTAQEKFTTVRTEKRGHPATVQTYPWLVRAPVLAKVYY